MDIELQLRLERLNADYAATIDDDRLEAWPEFFTDDCLYVVTHRESYDAGYRHGAIYANSKGMLIDRITSLRKANIYERHAYRHFLGGVRVESVEGGIAVARSNFMVVRIMHSGETMIFATGVYRDRIELAGEQPRFRERVAVCDSGRIDTLLVIPL